MTDHVDPERERRTAAEQQGAVAYEEHLRADRERFERRRDQLARDIAEDMAKELALSIGVIEIDDDENKRLVDEETRRIEEKYAERRALQMARIDREEQERLERTRALYDR